MMKLVTLHPDTSTTSLDGHIASQGTNQDGNLVLLLPDNQTVQAIIDTMHPISQEDVENDFELAQTAMSKLTPSETQGDFHAALDHSDTLMADQETVLADDLAGSMDETQGQADSETGRESRTEMVDASKPTPVLTDGPSGLMSAEEIEAQFPEPSVLTPVLNPVDEPKTYNPEMAPALPAFDPVDTKRERSGDDRIVVDTDLWDALLRWTPPTVLRDQHPELYANSVMMFGLLAANARRDHDKMDPDQWMIDDTVYRALPPVQAYHDAAKAYRDANAGLVGFAVKRHQQYEQDRDAWIVAQHDRLVAEYAAKVEPVPTDQSIRAELDGAKAVRDQLREALEVARVEAEDALLHHVADACHAQSVVELIQARKALRDMADQAHNTVPLSVVAAPVEPVVSEPVQDTVVSPSTPEPVVLTAPDPVSASQLEGSAESQLFAALFKDRPVDHRSVNDQVIGEDGSNLSEVSQDVGALLPPPPVMPVRDPADSIPLVADDSPVTVPMDMSRDAGLGEEGVDPVGAESDEVDLYASYGEVDDVSREDGVEPVRPVSRAKMVLLAVIMVLSMGAVVGAGYMGLEWLTGSDTGQVAPSEQVESEGVVEGDSGSVDGGLLASIDAAAIDRLYRPGDQIQVQVDGRVLDVTIQAFEGDNAVAVDKDNLKWSLSADQLRDHAKADKTGLFAQRLAEGSGS